MVTVMQPLVSTVPSSPTTWKSRSN
jgi:hypothetical protein